MIDPVQDEIDYRQLEWLASMFDEWLVDNEEAREIQRHLPPRVAAEVAELPPGFHGVAPALAFRSSPETLETAHAVFVSARRFIGQVMDGSVSHPSFRVDRHRPSDEKTGQDVSEDDLRAEVAAMKDQMDRLEAMLATLIEVAERDGQSRLRAG